MLTRRSVLRICAAAGPVWATGCGDEVPFVPEDVPEDPVVFPRTPMAGDMRGQRVVFTFHVADDRPVTFRAWTDAGVVVDWAIEPSGDGFHKVMVDQLIPGVTYRYAVFDGDAPDFSGRSLIGQVRMPPPDDVAVPIRVGLMSCIGRGTIVPDYYLHETDQWLVFPHELSGLSAEEIARAKPEIAAAISHRLKSD